MATFSLLSLAILIFLLSLYPTLLFSLSLPSSPHFDSNLILIGDANLPFGGSAPIQLTSSNSTSSSGLILRSKPFKFVTSSRTKRLNPVSFSTDFTFSISKDNGDGLALLLVPADFVPKFSSDNFGLSREHRYLGVEFDTLLNGDLRDENANHVGVDVGSLRSRKVSNVSSVNLVLNSGIKLHSWVDYDSSSKRLEVWLSEFGRPRPYNPLLACLIDLGEMWKGQEVLVGLSSSNGKSLQSTSIYSWKFRTRTVPKWLHSKPVDPSRFSNQQGGDKVINKKKGCLLWLLSSLICGMLIALGVLLMWLVFANNYQVTLIQMKRSANPEFRYEKVNVVVDDRLTSIKGKGGSPSIAG